MSREHCMNGDTRKKSSIKQEKIHPSCKISSDVTKNLGMDRHRIQIRRSVSFRMRRNRIRARAFTDRNRFRLSLSNPDSKWIGRCHSRLIRLIRFISIAILMVSFVIGRLLRNAKESAKLKG
ncbi:hypothetical protein BDB00DRAFT_931765 [Zychaea mexicana]|uniref:uncharacterized protein n=1 Tax=Zychaea mexicana TaxID=64656 RepID=UPI0022FDE5B1|nr:uncharacterized protein BDB00DRAFT_931765 [Zychaea mexicana]KAI9489723.1 hypothetical protein BDB00DRAFT_931765 [Zychaea mexicana]